MYALLTPLGPVLHRVVPTPERLVLALAVTALLLPFFLAFESLLRRGSPLRAAAWSIGGRLVTLAVLGLGVVAGALPGMVVLYLPVLAMVFVLVECLAAGVYRASRQPAVVGAVTAALVGLLVAVTVPVGGLTGLVAP